MSTRPSAPKTTCAQHRCPKVLVRGRLQCVVEYGETHLGQRRIVDVFPGSVRDRHISPACLILEDGHALPLYNADGHEPRLCPEGEANRILCSTSGLYVVGVAGGRGAGGRPPTVELALARRKNVDPNHPGLHRLQFLDVSLRSIQEITCPSRCRPPA